MVFGRHEDMSMIKKQMLIGTSGAAELLDRLGYDKAVTFCEGRMKSAKKSLTISRWRTMRRFLVEGIVK